MAIKYINIFYSKVLQNLSKLIFFVWKQTIWQPWRTLENRSRRNRGSPAATPYQNSLSWNPRTEPLFSREKLFSESRCNSRHSLPAGLPDFSWYKIPKRGKIYQITTNRTKCQWNITKDRKMDQVSIKYTNIFHCKTLKNFPKFGFLVWKQTIWQPCLPGLLRRAPAVGQTIRTRNSPKLRIANFAARNISGAKIVADCWPRVDSYGKVQKQSGSEGVPRPPISGPSWLCNLTWTNLK
jgi:hypothetical protein